MGTGFMTPTCATVDVKTTSTKVLDALTRPHNVGYRLLQNISDTNILLMFGAAAKNNEGILLAKNCTFEMYRAKDNFYDGEINAIHAGTGDKKILVTQG